MHEYFRFHQMILLSHIVIKQFFITNICAAENTASWQILFSLRVNFLINSKSLQTIINNANTKLPNKNVSCTKQTDDYSRLTTSMTADAPSSHNTLFELKQSNQIELEVPLHTTLFLMTLLLVFKYIQNKHFTKYLNFLFQQFVNFGY